MQTCSKTTLWVDSSYVATGLWRLIECVSCLPFDTNTDLWRKCQDIVQHCSERVRCQHIPSHRQEQDCFDPIDSWTCYWNGAADKAAGAAHSTHSPAKWTLWQELVRHQRAELAKLRKLQALHTAIAAKRGDLLKTHTWEDAVIDLEAEEVEHHHEVREAEKSWLDELPHDWAGKGQGVKSFLGFGPFGMQFVQTLLSVETDRGALLVSWLELTIWAWHTFQGRIPVPGLTKGMWVDPLAGGSTVSGSQTLAMALRCVKGLVRGLFEGLNLPVVEISGLNLTAYGVAPPQRGLALRWTTDRIGFVRGLLADFCCRRLIRTVNDLARPLKKTWSD